MDKKFTAYCGLCCLDCIPSNVEFFSLIQRLERMLEGRSFCRRGKIRVDAAFLDPLPDDELDAWEQ